MYETWLPTDVEAKLAKGEEMVIVDVRELDEWHRGHILEAQHIPLSDLGRRISELNKDQVNVMVCHSGARSSRACEYLAAEGYRVVNMLGGMSSWYGKVAH